MQPLGPIDAGQRIKLQRHDGLGLPLLHGLLGGAKLGGDAGALAQIPTPSGKDEAGSCGEEEKDLRHAQNPKRDQSARASIAEMRSAVNPPGERPKSNAPLSAKTLRRRRSQEVEGITSLRRTSSP